MGKEMDNFDVLEDRINRLADAYSALREERAALKNRLAERELEIQQLKEKVSHFSRERQLAREKVEGLLTRVDRLISSPAGMAKG